MAKLVLFCVSLVCLLSFTTSESCVGIGSDNLSQGCHTSGARTVCYKVNSLESIRSGSRSDELFLVQCDIENLSFENFQDRLTKISIEGSAATTTKSEPFSKLPNLQEIFLTDVQTKYLKDDLFKGATKTLKSIYMNKCGVENLTENVFSDQSSLQTLDLSQNSISSIHKDIFKGLASLKTLRLRDNRLSYIPPYTFEELLELDVLDLENNALNNFHNTTLNGLQKLRELNLDNNRMSAIFPGAFTSGTLLSLEYLYLKGNGIETVSLRSFDGLNSLKILCLDNNNISTLPTGVFDGLINLRIVSLKNNNMNVLLLDVFSNIPNLALLELDYKLRNIRDELAEKNKSVAVILNTINYKDDC